MDLLDGSDPDPLEELMVSERCAGLPRALGLLPEDLRRTLMLVYFQGLQYREAAEVLSIPVGTAKSRVHAAIQKLESYLTPVFRDDD